MRERALRASLARALKQWRAARGLTQRALAGKAGIGEKYLSRIERALATPSVLVVLKLAQALDVRLEELLALPAASPPPPHTSALLRVLAERSRSEVEQAERVLRALFR
ncbi:MAG TPA: helix-turn-helix transcriptional regulator [Polyangiaceae bacterium]|nr:helix-turn-helix transcriptional regulator [Polyangiaceae bacterium]